MNRDRFFTEVVLLRHPVYGTLLDQVSKSVELGLTDVPDDLYSAMFATVDMLAKTEGVEHPIMNAVYLLEKHFDVVKIVGDEYPTDYFVDILNAIFDLLAQLDELVAREYKQASKRWSKTRAQERKTLRAR